MHGDSARASCSKGVVQTHPDEVICPRAHLRLAGGRLPRNLCHRRFLEPPTNHAVQAAAATRRKQQRVTSAADIAGRELWPRFSMRLSETHLSTPIGMSRRFATRSYSCAPSDSCGVRALSCCRRAVCASRPEASSGGAPACDHGAMSAGCELVAKPGHPPGDTLCHLGCAVLLLGNVWQVLLDRCQVLVHCKCGWTRM